MNVPAFFMYLINALLFHAYTLLISHARGRSTALLQICFSIFKRIEDGNVSKIVFFFIEIRFPLQSNRSFPLGSVVRLVRPNIFRSIGIERTDFIWRSEGSVEHTPRWTTFYRCEYWTRKTFGIYRESTRHSIRYTHLAQSTDYFTLVVCYFWMRNAFGVLKIKIETLQMVERWWFFIRMGTRECVSTFNVLSGYSKHTPYLLWCRNKKCEKNERHSTRSSSCLLVSYQVALDERWTIGKWQKGRIVSFGQLIR